MSASRAASRNIFWPPPASRIGGRRVPRDECRVAVIDAEHQRLQTQRGGDLRRGSQRGNRRELVVEMIGDRQRRKAEVLRLAGELGPLPSRAKGAARREAEAKG